MAEPTDLREGDALVVVDVQPDFCPGGALPVPDGDAVIPVLNRWLEAAKRAGVTVVASRDWHPSQHPSFEVHGGPWPTHCVQGTPGAISVPMSSWLTPSALVTAPEVSPPATITRRAPASRAATAQAESVASTISPAPATPSFSCAARTLSGLAVA